VRGVENDLEAIAGHLHRPEARPAAFAGLRCTDHPIAGLRPLGGELERHGEVGGLDDPDAGEVLLAFKVGGSWPYGWNRSVV